MPLMYNSLASPDQLTTSSSQLDGVPLELEDSLRYAGARLTQAAGILLRLQQDTIAQAIVLFFRFWVGPDGGNMREHNIKDISLASLYLVAKLSSTPQTPRDILNVYHYLLSAVSPFQTPKAKAGELSSDVNFLTDAAYKEQRTALFRAETQFLRALGFHTQVALPYAVAINYLQALDVLDEPSGTDLAARTFAHLNTALLSTQLLYLTHQPSALAVAAIYLAAREKHVKLPRGEWWEIFDVDREELGFLVVAMRSMGAYAAVEEKRWRTRDIPFTAREVENEIEWQGMPESRT
ncbi:MAG: Cyclin-L1 [Vezdaea acicularis]|nr:MAG: Cyclin-L1 [Vezdaea acicularis]